jgi:hypothetical protein
MARRMYGGERGENCLGMLGKESTNSVKENRASLFLYLIANHISL